MIHAARFMNLQFSAESKNIWFFKDFCGKFFRMPAFAGMTSFRRKPESSISTKDIEEPNILRLS